MILTIGFVLLVAGATVAFALTEGHIGGNEAPQKKRVALCGLVLAVFGFVLIVVGILTSSMAGG